MRDDDEPDFLMSLGDTLTCGLGATILLFVIFMIVVTVQEPPPAPPDRALRQREVETAAGAAALWLRLRGDCAFIETVEAYPEVDVDRLRDGRDGAAEDTCVALFRHDDPPDTIRFRAAKAPARPIAPVIVLGGLDLTPADASWTYDGPDGGVFEIFTLRLDDPRTPVQPTSSWRIAP